VSQIDASSPAIGKVELAITADIISVSISLMDATLAGSQPLQFVIISSLLPSW